MNKKTLRDIDVSGKRVLVRVDFNLPMNETTGVITDDIRIRASLPTIQYLIDARARVILCSHLGRPKSKPEEKYSLRPVAKRLAEIIGKPVAFAADCIGPQAETAVRAMKDGDLLLLENVRFHAGEEKNDPDFARALATLADAYVDDAFAAAHRTHASIVGVTKHLPAVAGMLMEKELVTLGGLLKDPPRPFGALFGGAKVSDKVALMENVLHRLDVLLVGGGMAATFLKTKGYEVGQSLIEADLLDAAAMMTKKATGNGVRLVLPKDVVITDEISARGTARVVPVDRVPANMKIADIGPETVKSFGAELKACRTVFWNGPMGVYELPQFASGTRGMAELLADLKAKTIVGGGSTAEIVTTMGLADKMAFVSTGGGASMSYLSGEQLPGVEALLDK